MLLSLENHLWLRLWGCEIPLRGTLISAQGKAFPCEIQLLHRNMQWTIILIAWFYNDIWKLFVMTFIYSLFRFFPQRVTFRVKTRPHNFFFIWKHVKRWSVFANQLLSQVSTIYFYSFFLQHAMFNSVIVHVMYSVIQKHFALLSHTWQ